MMLFMSLILVQDLTLMTLWSLGLDLTTTTLSRALELVYQSMLYRQTVPWWRSNGGVSPTLKLIVLRLTES